MKKLLFLILLWPILAFGQTTPAADTVIAIPNTLYTPVWKYTITNGYLTPYQNINGKYYYMPTNKAIRAYFVPQTTTITAGNGLIGGGALSGNIAFRSDTSVLQTIANLFPLADTRYYTKTIGDIRYLRWSDTTSTVVNKTYGLRYVPYDNWTKDVTAGNRNLLLGTGYYSMSTLSGKPTGVSGEIRMYRDSAGRWSYMNGLVRRTFAIRRAVDNTITYPWKLNPTLSDSTENSTLYVRNGTTAVNQNFNLGIGTATAGTFYTTAGGGGQISLNQGYIGSVAWPGTFLNFGSGLGLNSDYGISLNIAGTNKVVLNSSSLVSKVPVTATGFVGTTVTTGANTDSLLVKKSTDNIFYKIAPISTTLGSYLTTATAASTYASLTGSYSDPSWITSLAHSKITYTGTTAQYIRGDGTYATLQSFLGSPTTSVIPKYTSIGTLTGSAITENGASFKINYGGVDRVFLTDYGKATFTVADGSGNEKGSVSIGTPNGFAGFAIFNTDGTGVRAWTGPGGGLYIRANGAGIPQLSLGIDSALTLNGAMKAQSYRVPGKGANSFLKADATLDSTSYYPYPTGSVGSYVRGNGSVATFPTTVSTFSNDAGYLTNTTGDARYIRQTGTSGQYITGAGTFVTFPTALSSFTNDPGYITSASIPTYTASAGVSKVSNDFRLDLTSANVFTAGQTVSRSGIATTSTEGLFLTNPATATSGVPIQYSPRLHWKGAAYNTGTTTSNSVDVVQEVRPNSSGTPGITFVTAYSTNGGAYTDLVNLTQSGSLRTLAGYANIIAGANSTLDLQTTGALISRNQTTGVTLTVNSINASNSASITEFQWQGTTKSSISNAGSYRAGTGFNSSLIQSTAMTAYGGSSTEFISVISDHLEFSHGSFDSYLYWNNHTGNRIVYLPDANGTIALTQDLYKLKPYTVATLPTGAVGYIAYVTDALAPTYGATVVGGGAITAMVFYNGTNWVTQ